MPNEPDERSRLELFAVHDPEVAGALEHLRRLGSEAFLEELEARFLERLQPADRELWSAFLHGGETSPVRPSPDAIRRARRALHEAAVALRSSAESEAAKAFYAEVAAYLEGDPGTLADLLVGLPPRPK